MRALHGAANEGVRLRRAGPRRIGGVTGWQRAAAIAAAAGIPISTHLYPEVAAHVLRVSETAHWLEWQDWANPVLQ
jgi:mandelate racemase